MDSTVPTLEHQQNDIMNRFEFDRALSVMHFLKWQWRGQDVTLDDLKSNALYLMDQVTQEYCKKPGDWASVATGGFEARVMVSKGCPQLSLVFSPASTHAFV